MNLLKLSTFGASAALAIILVGCAGTPSPSPAASRNPDAISLDVASDQPIDADAATLVVFGMSCPQCSTNVAKQLERLPGVVGTSTDLGTGDVIVSFAKDGPHPTPADLGQAISFSGFTLQSITVE